MKAITYHRYGPPEVIGIEEVATPTPAEGQILVRVHASVVTPADGAARIRSPQGSHPNGLRHTLPGVVLDALEPA